MSYPNRYASSDDEQAEMDYDDDPRPGRLPTSSRRYDLTTPGRASYRVHSTQAQRALIPARRSALSPTGQSMTYEPPPARRQRHWLLLAHPLVWLGCGMLAMLFLWVGLQDLGAWWTLHQDDVTYGRPRTAQYDVVVGHGDSAQHPSHFLALNLNATVEIIEVPGGDITKARIYQGPHLFGPGADLFPVTLTFPDPGGDGKPDMDIHVQGQIIVYLNQNGQFVPQPLSH